MQMSARASLSGTGPISRCKNPGPSNATLQLHSCFDYASLIHCHIAKAFDANHAPPQQICAPAHTQTMQVVWETQLSTADESALQDAMLQRLAEREIGYYGRPGLPRPGAISKGAAPGMVRR